MVPGGSVIHGHDYASLALEDLTAGRPGEVGDVEEELENLVARYSRYRLDAVISTDDYPGSALAAILAERLGLAGVAPAVNLACQHKFYSRRLQCEVEPSCVPPYQLLNRPEELALELPILVKPVKSFFSVGATPVRSPRQLASASARARLPEPFFRPFAALFERYVGQPMGRGRVLAEGLLRGKQVTVEGFAFRGRITILGVVDSVMLPGTRAFQRFEYPSSLAASVQERMQALAIRLMAGLGYRDGMFNVEMMFDPKRDAIQVIEINPRMSSQFADLLEKVDGTNSYEVLLDIARGCEPKPRRGCGRYAMVASCVLRTRRDKFVVRVPSQEEVEGLLSERPDLRIEILASPGEALSEQMQDEFSYRYGLIDIGGEDRREILSILDYCRSRLSFELVEPGRQTRASAPSRNHPTRGGVY